jgi:signal transduction histidine kinase/ActR/RegA family two-component response regulator
VSVRKTSAKISARPVKAESPNQLRGKVTRLEQEIHRLRGRAAELEAERDEYLDLYEQAPVPALTLDTAYVIRRVNQEGAQLLGGSPVGLLDRSFRGLLAPLDRAAFAAALARSRAVTSVEKLRVNLALSFVPAFPVHVWARFSPKRGVFEIRLLDLRELERAREDARRLAESERSAREASAAKDKFIAVLSHELRAPLTPVLAAASALRGRALPGPIREAFEMIERNVAAEARLIDDLLDVNRIVRNKMHVELRVADVHTIARDAVDTLAPELEAKRHHLDMQLGARFHYAKVDPLRLRQVFMNLLKNAIKFTSPGGRLRVQSWDSAGNIAVEIEDNGSGIEPETMRWLFEPFMEERNTAATGGLGLGLAISKGLIELQGGKISAHSRGPGRGARFVVEVPIVNEKPVEEEPAVPARSEPPHSSGEHPPRVLLVDDHEDTVEILCDLLTENGFQVETANSVAAARSIDLEHVDVIVSDIGLPDGSGLDLMRELRTRTNRPAIALSGFGMESDVNAAEDAGFDLHLTKPVDIDRLLSAIENLCSKARRSRSGEPPSHDHGSPDQLHS